MNKTQRLPERFPQNNSPETAKIHNQVSLNNSEYLIHLTDICNMHHYIKDSKSLTIKTV